MIAPIPPGAAIWRLAVGAVDFVRGFFGAAYDQVRHVGARRGR